MTQRIAFAAIVGLIALSMLSPALAHKHKRPAASRTPVAMTADEALVAAREAFVKNDLERFDAAAAQARAHTLAGYLDFWRLRLRLQDPHPDALSGGADAEVQRYLERHAGSLVADLMRRDWMLNLGRRGLWTTFDTEYPKWVLRDDEEVHCYASLGRVQRGQPAAEGRTELFPVRNLTDGCAALFDAQVRSGAMSRGDLFARLLVALEANVPEAIRRVGEHLGIDASALQRALSKPVKALEARPTREITLVALTRIAREDPADAIKRLSRSGEVLNDADRAFVWSQIAASGMRHLDPRALEWARLATKAPAGDETWPWLARAALREQDWPALNTFIERMSESTRHDAAWVYWRARALHASGASVAGDALLETIAGQFSFYGQLAAEELGRLTAPPPRAVAPTDEELAEPAANTGFRDALLFYRLGLRLEGNREWNYQLRGMSDRRLLAAALWACRQQILDRCVNTADRTRSEHDFVLRFVSPFLEQMKPVAARHDLDPAWVYGLIRQESRFIMDARSWAGAQGLMQIMPATGRWIARKLGERDFRVEHLSQLDTNLRFGTYYLRSVLDDLEGSPVLASAAYNAGPGRPRNWRATLAKPVEGAIFAEIIPFSETRDYVKKVLSNAVFYAALFTGEPQSLKARLGYVSPQPALATEIP